MSLIKIQKEILNNIVEKSNKTNEENLKLSKEELVKRIDAINHGYLEVLECEHRILERQGLIKGYFIEGEVMFNIPNWDRFITAVNAFYITCYVEEVDVKHE